MLKLFMVLIAMSNLVFTAGADDKVIKIWAGSEAGVRGSLGDDFEKDVPILTVYKPMAEKSTGAAIVVCPGGGYGVLAGHEGKDYALWLNGQGITAFVLKYRHPAI